MKKAYIPKTYRAYLAGIIDSDGSISVIKRTGQSTKKGYSYRELVQLTWKQSPFALALMAELKDNFGGSVFSSVKKANTYNSNPTLIYKYTLEAKGAEKLIRLIHPYLRIKQSQATLLLEMRDLKKVKYGSTNIKPQMIWLREAEVYDLFKRLNSKNNLRGKSDEAQG